MQCMFLIKLTKSFLSLAVTTPFVPFMTEAPSHTKTFKFRISIATSWNFLVRHVPIASAFREASSECFKRLERSMNTVSTLLLSVSKHFKKDTHWYMFEISVPLSVHNAKKLSVQ